MEDFAKSVVTVEEAVQKYFDFKNYSETRKVQLDEVHLQQ